VLNYAIDGELVLSIYDGGGWANYAGVVGGRRPVAGWRPKPAVEPS
jgi:hypothetical protein